MIRIVVADDQELMRMGLRTLIENEDGLEFAGEASDGLQAVDVVRRVRPDIVLMDIRMPGIDGLEATRRITADPALGGTRIIVLTTFENDDYVVSALRGGASGFLLKDTPPTGLVDALRVVSSGESLLSPRATTMLVRRFLQGGDDASRPVPAMPAEGPAAELTARETEVLGLVGRGSNNTQIAEALTISVATARTHVGRILAKTEARDRAQLVVLAHQWGLV